MDKQKGVINMNKFQITYILVFFINLIGIAGNIELEITTPITSWIIATISSFLTVGKLIYLERRK